MASYLTARALLRQAKLSGTPQSYAAAGKAVDALIAAPAGAFGQGDAAGMARFLLERQEPPKALAELDAELTRPAMTRERRVVLSRLRRPQRQDHVTARDPRLDRDDQGERRGNAHARRNNGPSDAERGQKRAQAFSLAHAEARWQATKTWRG